MLFFAHATLTAKGHLHIARPPGRARPHGDVSWGVGMCTAISIAIARLVGTRVLEYAADRRRVAERLSGRSIASKHHALPPGKQLSVPAHRAVLAVISPIVPQYQYRPCILSTAVPSRQSRIPISSSLGDQEIGNRSLLDVERGGKLR